MILVGLKTEWFSLNETVLFFQCYDLGCMKQKSAFEHAAVLHMHKVSLLSILYIL